MHKKVYHVYMYPASLTFSEAVRVHKAIDIAIAKTKAEAEKIMEKIRENKKSEVFYVYY